MVCFEAPVNDEKPIEQVYHPVVKLTTPTHGSHWMDGQAV